MVEAETTRWASATFTGARHALTLLTPDWLTAREWVAGLPEAELPLRSHLVADLEIDVITCDWSCVTVEIEVLTVEDVSG